MADVHSTVEPVSPMPPEKVALTKMREPDERGKLFAEPDRNKMPSKAAIDPNEKKYIYMKVVWGEIVYIN